MHDYTPTSQWASNMPELDDGDPPQAATWQVTEEDQFDRLKYLYDRTGGALGSLTRTQIVKFYRDDDWSLGHGVQSAYHLEANVGPGDTAVWVRYLLSVPHGAMLTAVTIHIHPGSGHTSLPATKPHADLYERTLSTDVAASLGSATDGTVLASYDSVHSFAISGLSTVVDNATKMLELNVRSEGGTDARTGFLIVGVTATFTMSTLDPGAA